MDNLEFETLSSAEFKEYMQTHKEKNYLVIDVRQASEYEEGHIPGAKLMPLSEVETRLFTLTSERDLIFYCANGGRSKWAASLAGEGEVSKKTVYHLTGYMRVWQGKFWKAAIILKRLAANWIQFENTVVPLSSSLP
jgi:rhodanese-related sulfurtransferase